MKSEGRNKKRDDEIDRVFPSEPQAKHLEQNNYSYEKKLFLMAGSESNVSAGKTGVGRGGRSFCEGKHKIDKKEGGHRKRKRAIDKLPGGFARVLLECTKKRN